MNKQIGRLKWENTKVPIRNLNGDVRRVFDVKPDSG